MALSNPQSKTREERLNEIISSLVTEYSSTWCTCNRVLARDPFHLLFGCSIASSLQLILQCIIFSNQCILLRYKVRSCKGLVSKFVCKASYLISTCFNSILLGGISPRIKKAVPLLSPRTDKKELKKLGALRASDCCPTSYSKT